MIEIPEDKPKSNGWGTLTILLIIFIMWGKSVSGKQLVFAAMLALVVWGIVGGVAWLGHLLGSILS